MRDPMNQSTDSFGEEMRNAQLARGLRTVAATLIVGGIVIAALEGGAPSNRAAGNAPVGPADSYRTAAPPASPASNSPAPRTSGVEDPALGPLDKAMEQHG